MPAIASQLEVSMEEVIQVHKIDENIVCLVLNRPDKLNALTKPMWAQLGETMRALAHDEDIRCIVLRGAGDKSFSPGNDISEFETERANVKQARVYGKVMRDTLEAIDNCPHPTVALIQGICIGGGLEIAAHCDLRVCGQSSRFGVPINRLGLVMSYAEISGLLKLVGRATTLDLLLQGRIVEAAEAKDLGLVNWVVSDDSVEEEAFTIAGRIAQGAPLVARWHKKFINRLQHPDPLSDEEVDEGFDCYETQDFQIGYQSFLKKQKPVFKGQ